MQCKTGNMEAVRACKLSICNDIKRQRGSHAQAESARPQSGAAPGELRTHTAMQGNTAFS